MPGLITREAVAQSIRHAALAAGMPVAVSVPSALKYPEVPQSPLLEKLDVNVGAGGDTHSGTASNTVVSHVGSKTVESIVQSAALFVYTTEV